MKSLLAFVCLLFGNRLSLDPTSLVRTPTNHNITRSHAASRRSVIGTVNAGLEAGDAILTAATPWFAADHIVATVGSSKDVAACDWCGASLGAARTGCSGCGCAAYCKASCAAEAETVHNRNCARLAFLSRGNAQRFVPADASPMFDFD